MRADLLHVIACVANPVRWESRIRLAKDFIAHMLDSGVNLTLVECAYGERPYDLAGIPHINHVPVRARSIVWNKEGLLNLGVQRLPESARYFAFLDADIQFMRPDWASETVDELQLYSLMQPWDTCYDLGPKGVHMQVHKSFASLWFEGGIAPGGTAGMYENKATFPHPGYAFAMTRDLYARVGGLLEAAAAGAGDHHMWLSAIGRAGESLPGGINPNYRKAVLDWQDRLQKHLNGKIGFLPGTIMHGFHGAKKNRYYISRWDILTNNDFDPFSDVKRNEWGVLELSGNKPQLALDIDRYMRSRLEDSSEA